MWHGTSTGDRLRETTYAADNRRVLLLTALTFAAAAALWTVLYFVVWWFFLLANTVTKPLDFHPASAPVVRGFTASALLLCLSAWIARRVRPDETPRDHKGFVGHFIDLLLAVPRLTISIFGTGGAAVRLSDLELNHAWHLLRRMDEAGNPVALQTLPVDIPDSTQRNHILMALQYTGLIEIRATAAGPVLAFRSSEARRLLQDKARLRF